MIMFKTLNMIKHLKKIEIATLLAFIVIIAGCKKNYYTDTGLQTSGFDGSVLQYLQSKPQYFDSLVKVIHLAGMDDIFQKEDITFFAPADSSINATIRVLNDYENSRGLTMVYKLEQIKPEVWRRQLSRYLFKGKKAMNDYPQIDPGNLSAYPGQIYSSYDGLLMNVGVIYDDAGGVKYAGYRHLQLSYIPSVSAPRDFTSWYSVGIASVNVAPKNGFVHVLKYSQHFFGFETGQFIEDAISKGIDP